MAKTNLEKSISEAANSFALEIIEAVKNATLQELIAMQGSEVPRKTRSATKRAAASKSTAAPKKKRNYPKCAFPSCEKNKFARGKGFCGEHWKEFMAGKIKAAEAYK